MSRIALLVASLLVLVGAAAAHEETLPKRDRLELGPDRLTLHIDYSVSGADSLLLRQLFDRDRSGRLDDGEQQALLRHLAHLATAFVQIQLDGSLLPLRPSQGLLGDGATGLSAVFTLTAPLALTAGHHRLRIADRHKDRRQAVPLRISVKGLTITTALPPLPPLPLLADGQPLDLELFTSGQPGS